MDASNHCTDVEFPVIPAAVVSDLIDKAVEAMSLNSAIIDIPSPIVFVGDLHGNLNDLLRIFHVFGVPPETKYIFLGDYVDRGENSVAVISLILSFMVTFPEQVFLLRGNHEFSHINKAYGFHDEILGVYGCDDLWCKFQDVFSWLPLAAVVQRSIFCVHGGLSPLLNEIETLRTLPMPIRDYLSNTMISDLVWSDPADRIRGFHLNHRGSGQLFGPDSVEQFLKGNSLKLMIRAHQCTASGFRAFADFMGITVFSSSNYCNLMDNKCGVVVLKDDREISFFNMAPDSDVDTMLGVAMTLPLDGDVGLKRMFRTISRPEMRDEAGEDQRAQSGFRRSQSVCENLSTAA